MKYVKFISETQIEYPPINKGNVINYNLDVTRLLADGYKPLEEAEKPQGEYTLTYRDDGDHITEIVTVPTPEELARRREAQFKTDFFQTSLGWVRRSVNMLNGSKKDFLSDLLPSISIAVASGEQVTILTYTEPDYTQDVEDWTQYQQEVIATPQFVNECMLRLANDFRTAQLER